MDLARHHRHGTKVEIELLDSNGEAVSKIILDCRPTSSSWAATVIPVLGKPRRWSSRVCYPSN
jgi:hypothetical protein